MKLEKKDWLVWKGLFDVPTTLQAIDPLKSTYTTIHCIFVGTS